MAKVGSLVIGVLANVGPLEKSLKKAERIIDRAGGRMKNIGTKMTMGVTLPIVAVGAAAVKSAVDFESAFAGVEKTVDGTAEQMDRLRTGIKRMSTEIPAATTEISRVAEAAGQLGIQTESILGFTRTMIDLGETTNMTAEQAATALARLANITQMPQHQFDRLGSVLVDLGNNLATTEAEITQMGLRLAGAGQQVGLTQAQILSFAGALSSVGVEAQAGGTAFSRSFIEISKAVDKGGQKLKILAYVAGKSSKKFAEAFRVDAAGAMVDFVEGLGRIKKEGKSVFDVLESLGLGEIRVRDALLRASGAGDLFRRSLEIGTKAWEENTALTEEAEKRYKTIASQLNILKNRLAIVAVELGDTLVPAMMKAIDAADPVLDMIKGMAHAFSEMDPAVKSTVIGFFAVVAVAGPLIWVLGTIVSSIGAVLGAIVSVSAFIVKLGGAIKILVVAVGAGVGLVVAALALAGVAIYLWVTRWEELKRDTVIIWNFLIEKGVEIFGNIKTSIVGIITEMVSLIRGQFVERLMGLVSSITEFKDRAIHIFQTLKDVVVGHSIIPDMVKSIKSWLEKIGPMMGDVGAKMEAFRSSAARSIGALTGDLVMGKRSFESWAAAVVIAIGKVIAQMMVLRMIKGAAGQAAGLGFVGSVFGGFAGGFVAGGTLERGQWGVAGENGPEPIFAGRQPLTVMPSLAGAGGPNVTIHQTFSLTGIDISSRPAARKMLRTLADEAQQGTQEAVTFALRSKDLGEKYDGRAR